MNGVVGRKVVDFPAIIWASVQEYIVNTNPNLILSVGTQVVAHIDIKNNNGDVLFVRGVVGVITKSPVDQNHAYRVRFMDGTEWSLHHPSSRASLSGLC